MLICFYSSLSIGEIAAITVSVTASDVKFNSHPKIDNSHCIAGRMLASEYVIIILLRRSGKEHECLPMSSQLHNQRKTQSKR